MILRVGIAVVMCVAAVGCCRNPYLDVYLDALNTEKRVLEDRLYDLQYKYEQAQKELEACRSQAKAAAEGGPRREKPGELPPLPKVELPPELEQELKQPREKSVPRAQPAEAVPPPEDGAAAHAHGSSPAPPLDRRVEYITINPRLTGAEDFDQRLGDDGFTVAIEPRNKQGQFVPKPAPVSIVLLDPSKRGAAARYARWDFDRQVAEKVLVAGSLDRGLLFRVPWPHGPPDADRLDLFVRYVTDDGRKLEAHREIAVHRPDRLASGWTPRPPRAPSAGGSGEDKFVVDRTGDLRAPTTVRAAYEASGPSPAVGTSARRTDRRAGEAPSPRRPGRLWQPTRPPRRNK